MECTKIPKKNIEFSKIPKLLWTSPDIFGILEFWKTRCFFWNFVEFQKNPFQKNPRFFGIWSKNSKNPVFFLEFAMTFQKKHSFFFRFSTKIQKKPGSKFQKSIEFSKIPKFSRLCLSLQIFLEFWNFGKLEVFFWNFKGICPKNRWYHFFLWLAHA